MDLFGSSCWTLEKCLDEAKKYINKGQLQVQSPVAFIEAKKQGFLGEIDAYYSQLSLSKVTADITYEEIRQVAATCVNATEFRRAAPERHSHAVDKDYMSALSAQLWKKSYAKSLAVEARSKFNSYIEWRKANPEEDENLRLKGQRKKFFKEFYPELNYTTVLMDALQYTSRDKWKEGSPEYRELAAVFGYSARINKSRAFFHLHVAPVGFIHTNTESGVCSKTPNDKAPVVYKCSQMSIYNNERSRMIIYGSRPSENNKHSWTKERAAKEALKYKVKHHFRKGSWSAFQFVMDNDLYDELCSHFDVNTPKGYWTEDRVRLEASKYNSAEDFLEYSSGAYQAASKLGVLTSLTDSMTKKTRDPYTVESATEAARNYKSMGEIKRKASGLHNWLFKLGKRKPEVVDTILLEAGVERGTPKGTLTKEYCASIAQGYTKFSEFRENEKSVYLKSCTEEWVEELTSHMERARLPRGYWTRDRCWDYFKAYDGNENRLKKDFSGCVTAIRRFELLNDFKKRLDAEKALELS